jgi:hypothetical protein
MGRLRFQEIHALPCVDETILTDSRTVRLDGLRFTWEALIFRGKILEDRVAARRLARADGTPATRTEEFRLFIRGQIPLAYHGGGWLPPRLEGGPPVAATGGLAWTEQKAGIDYRGKVEEVEALQDGRRVRHIVPEGGACPFFAVETAHSVKTVRTEQRIVQDLEAAPVREGEGEVEAVNPDGTRGEAAPLGEQIRGASKNMRYALPDLADLKASGALKEGETLLEVVGVEAERKIDRRAIGDLKYRTRLVTVEIPAVKVWTTAELFPYDEMGVYGD